MGRVFFSWRVSVGGAIGPELENLVVRHTIGCTQQPATTPPAQVTIRA